MMTKGLLRRQPTCIRLHYGGCVVTKDSEPFVFLTERLFLSLSFSRSLHFVFHSKCSSVLNTHISVCYVCRILFKIFDLHFNKT